jgi:hypothetical protein
VSFAAPALPPPFQSPRGKVVPHPGPRPVPVFSSQATTLLSCDPQRPKFIRRIVLDVALPDGERGTAVMYTTHQPPVL